MNSQELRELKEEYETMNRSIKQIKVLPRIMEEADIYEEVDKMASKSNSQNDANSSKNDIIEDEKLGRFM